MKSIPPNYNKIKKKIKLNIINKYQHNLNGNNYPK